MRQRLLLVAGWAVAAVATGLVSAGAVAVAGGQVTDRPLRPLSAAEVAALPVPVDDPLVTSEPLASGGSASLRGSDTPERTGGLQAPGDDTARPAEKEHDPYGASEHFPLEDLAPDLSLDDYADDGVFPRGVELPTIGRRPPEPEVVELTGGRVSVSLSDDAIVLNAATPRPGFVADAVFDDPTRLSITFWDGLHLSSLVVTVENGDLVVVTDEQDL